MKPRLVFCLLLVAAGLGKAETVTLLDGKLKLDTGEAFIQEKEAKAEKKSELAYFAARDSDGWGAITRGTHGLKPDGLATYLKNKVAEYTKGLSWLPQLKWLKKEIVTINGRQWADLRYIAPKAHPANPPGGVAYAHIHVGFELILYILEGKVRHEFGPGLKQVLENQAGDFIYIKPGVPHEVFNMSETEPVVAFVARSSADEWDNIIPYDRNQPG